MPVLRTVHTLIVSFSERNRDVNPYAVLGLIDVFEGELIMIVQLQTVRRVRKPNAERRRRRRRRTYRTAICQRKVQPLTLPIGTKTNLTRMLRAGGTMPDCIFKERLQQQLGYFSRGCFGLDIVIHDQAIAQS